MPELWGLGPEAVEGTGPSYHYPVLYLLLLILRIPGLFLLDLCWSDWVPGEVWLVCLAAALSILLLPIKPLVRLYAHFLASCALFLGYRIAERYVEEEVELSKKQGIWSYAALTRHFCSVASYLTLSMFVSWSTDLPSGSSLRNLVPACYCLPVFLRVLGLSLSSLEWVTNVVTGALLLSCSGYCLGLASAVLSYLLAVKELYSALWQELGWMNLCVLLVRRMFEPSVLVLYWLAMLATQCWVNAQGLSQIQYTIQDSNLLIELLVAVAEVCSTPLSLISFCLTLMFLSYSVLTLLKKVLSLCGAQVVPSHSGLTEGVIAFVLSLQTGLLELEMPSRVGALSIIIFVVTSSLIQSALEVASPALISMPATLRSWWCHLLPLLLVLSLLTAPLLMVAGLLSHVSSALWTVVIVSSCLVTAVQALGSLATYAVFIWDSHLPEPSPNTDDYVYYVKATTKSLEVLMAIVLVSEGFYSSLLDKEWNILNNVVLGIHCYFNIYLRVSQGWAGYLARRETSARIQELPRASQQELEEHRDVCSICYQDMSSAEGSAACVVTQCRHIFHTHCLRRWLVVQDNCPLCTQAIVKQEELAESVVDSEEETRNDVDVSVDKENVSVDDHNQQESNDKESDQLSLPIETFPPETPELRRRVTVNDLFDGD